MRRPRVVLLSYVVPHADIPHAGGRYLLALCQVLEREVDLTFLAPYTRVNAGAVAAPGAPANVVLVGSPGRRLPARILNRLALLADRGLRPHDPGAPYLPFVMGILRDPAVRRTIRRADVLDLQWLDSIRVLPVLRLLNRRARAVGTFHDVQSQSFSREPARDARERRYWRRMTRRAQCHERRAVAGLDAVLAFSPKDLTLLGDPANGALVLPPLAPGEAPAHPPAGGVPTVLFVSYLARAENDQAARWLLASIWPRVLAAHPDAALRIVGSGAAPDLIEQAAASRAVTLAGFVPDLADEYARAWVAIIPLLQGAGVKFKTVEALWHGVPTVTTTVGAEGIDGPDLFAGVSDDAATLAAAVSTALADPAAAAGQALRAQAWVGRTYGREQFVASIRRAISPAGH